jgi:hypothetical protein
MFRFHKMQGISWLAEELLDSQEGLCPMDLVICICMFICICVCMYIYIYIYIYMLCGQST